eukprot:EG_transcript_9017
MVWPASRRREAPLRLPWTAWLGLLGLSIAMFLTSKWATELAMGRAVHHFLRNAPTRATTGAVPADPLSRRPLHVGERAESEGQGPPHAVQSQWVWRGLDPLLAQRVAMNGKPVPATAAAGRNEGQVNAQPTQVVSDQKIVMDATLGQTREATKMEAELVVPDYVGTSQFIAAQAPWSRTVSTIGMLRGAIAGITVLFTVSLALFEGLAKLQSSHRPSAPPSAFSLA